jgi:hypothetical protein
MNPEDDPAVLARSLSLCAPTSFFSLPSIDASPMWSSCRTPSASMVKVGDGLHSEQHGDGTREALVAILQPGHLILLNKILPLLFMGIDAHAEHYQRLPLKILSYLSHAGNASRQGAYHVAQKSISTTLACNSSMEIRCPSLVVTASAILARAGSRTERSARWRCGSSPGRSFAKRSNCALATTK